MLSKIINHVNPEWFRESPSRLEATLRRPYLHKFVLILLLRRIFSKWILASLVLRILSINAFTSIILGFLFTITVEVFTLRDYYEYQAVPNQLKNVDYIKKHLKKAKKVSRKELVRVIDESVKASSRGLINIVYIALSVVGWTFIFKVLYPLITNTDIPYHQLLIGLNNKNIESNQKLWEVAHTENKERQKRALERYLSEYGSKVDDLDLSMLTLREQPKVVNKLLELYSKTESPNDVLEKQKVRRRVNTKEVMKSIRIPGRLFINLLKKVQANVSIREGRRFYALLPDYYNRKMLLVLAERMGVGETQIFSMSWEDIKNEVKKHDS